MKARIRHKCATTADTWGQLVFCPGGSIYGMETSHLEWVGGLRMNHLMLQGLMQRWCTCLKLDKLWRSVLRGQRSTSCRGAQTAQATSEPPYRSHTSLARGLWENQFSFPCFTGSLRKRGFPIPIWQHNPRDSRHERRGVAFH